MGPIDYSGAFPQIDLGQKFLSGLQAGADIGEIQQQADARALAIQQKQLAMQQAAQYQADLNSAFSAPIDQQPQLFAKLAIANPQYYEAISKGFGALSADQQKNELRDTYSIASTLQAGRKDLALQQIDDRIAAHKNSGQPTADLEALRTQVEADPKAAYGQVLHIVSGLPGGNDVLKSLQGQNESDANVAGKQADTTLKNLGIAGQTLGSLQGKNAKPAQAITAIKSLQARGVLSADEAQAKIDSVPTDPKALDDWFGQQRAAGMKADDQQKYLTPDANAQLSANTQIKTTGMNNTTQLAVQDRIAARQDSKGDSEPTLEPETLTTMAQQYLAGDKSVMQNLGRGAQGAANVVALRQAITKEAKAQGLSGPQIAAKMADYQGMTAGIRTSANISARVENAAAEAANLAPLAIAAGREVTRSGFLPFGKIGVMFDTQTNDPKLKRFATANIGLATAYANAMARGQKATVEDNKHSRELLSTATSQPAYEAVVNQMLQEIATARQAPEEVRRNLRSQIGGAPGSAPATPALPTGWTVKVH